MCTGIFLVRHGESTWNVEHRWAGQADPPLSAMGRQQAVALAARLRACDFSIVVTSPLRRATQTAEAIALELGLPRPLAVPDLAERHAGTWQGRTSEEIEADYPGQLARWRAGHRIDPPGAEDWDGFTSRVMAALSALPDPESVIAVSHQGVLRAVEHSLGLPPAAGTNASGLHLRVEPDTRTLAAQPSPTNLG